MRCLPLTHESTSREYAGAMRWLLFAALLLALLAVCPRMSADDRPTSSNRCARGVSHDPSRHDEPVSRWVAIEIAQTSHRQEHAGSILHGDTHTAVRPVVAAAARAQSVAASSFSRSANLYPLLI